jgi:hypothetical protein
MEALMPETTRRKFGIADAMILVVGVALSFAWVKHHDENEPSLLVDLEGFNRAERVIYAMRGNQVPAIVPLMFALSLIALMSLSREEILSRPGSMAPMVVAGVGLANVTSEMANNLYQYFRFLGQGPPLSQLLPSLDSLITVGNWYNVNDIPLSIAVVWLYMRLSGRWEARKDWLDRSGRAIGIYWIVMMFLPRI